MLPHHTLAMASTAPQSAVSPPAATHSHLLPTLTTLCKGPQLNSASGNHESTWIQKLLIKGFCSDGDPTFDVKKEKDAIRKERKRKSFIEDVLERLDHEGGVAAASATAAPTSPPPPPPTTSNPATTTRRRKKIPCPIEHCNASVWRMKGHLMSVHKLPEARAAHWYTMQGARDTKRPKKECKLCRAWLANLGQHLQQVHGMAPDEECRDALGLPPLAPRETDTPVEDWVPKDIKYREVWSAFSTYLWTEKGRKGSVPTDVKGIINLFRKIDKRVDLLTLFQPRRSDEDSLAPIFIAKVQRAAAEQCSEDLRKASSMLNKVNNVRTFCDFLVSRRRYWLNGEGGCAEHVASFQKELAVYNSKNFGRLKRQRELQLGHRTRDNPPLFKAVKRAIACLERQLIAGQLTDKDRRDVLMAYLVGTNLSRSGELQGLTTEEILNAEVPTTRPGWRVVKVMNHKTSSTHGPACLVIEEDVYEILKSFVILQDSKYAFQTESGKRLTRSHLSKVMLRKLHISPSKWRRLFGHHIRSQGRQFTRVLSTKMMHSLSTHQRWYTGVEREELFLDLVIIAQGLEPPNHTLIRKEEDVDQANQENKDEPELSASSSSDNSEDEAPLKTTATATVTPIATATATSQVTPGASAEDMPAPLTRGDLPADLQDWFVLPTRPFQESDFTQGGRYSGQQLIWLHTLFGGYRGERMRLDAIKAMLAHMPTQVSALFRTKMAQQLRDKIRCWNL